MLAGTVGLLPSMAGVLEQRAGGCRCQALALAGAADAVDPACSFSPLHEMLVALAESESAAPPPAFRYRGSL